MCVTKKKWEKRTWRSIVRWAAVVLAAVMLAGILAVPTLLAKEASDDSAETPAQEKTVSDNDAPQESGQDQGKPDGQDQEKPDGQDQEKPDGQDQPKPEEPKKPDPPRITSEPENAQVETGDYASFNVSAVGEELSYQWLVDKGDGAGFRKVPGAVSELYRIMVFDGEMNGYVYKCEVKNEGGSVRSRAAKLTIFYKIVGGAQSVWVKSSGRGLVFQGSGAYSAFNGVSVDGSRITAGEYNKGGSQSPFTEITLLRSYLETLGEGDHELEMVWSDGSAKTSFRIEPPAGNLSADVSGLGRAGADGTGSSRAAGTTAAAKDAAGLEDMTGGKETERTPTGDEDAQVPDDSAQISGNTADSLSENTVKSSSGTAADVLTAVGIFKDLPEMTVTPGTRRTQGLPTGPEKQSVRLAAMSETIDRYALTICKTIILISAAGTASGLIAYRLHGREERRNER